jgi:hypothetical protein
MLEKVGVHLEVIYLVVTGNQLVFPPEKAEKRAAGNPSNSDDVIDRDGFESTLNEQWQRYSTNG